MLEGLEGASAQTGTKFDRGAMEETLAALGSRVFLMNNVHDDGPTVFQTRWGHVLPSWSSQSSADTEVDGCASRRTNPPMQSGGRDGA